MSENGETSTSLIVSCRYSLSPIVSSNGSTVSTNEALHNNTGLGKDVARRVSDDTISDTIVDNLLSIGKEQGEEATTEEALKALFKVSFFRTPKDEKLEFQRGFYRGGT